MVARPRRLAVYQHGRRRLDEELGLEPSPALQRMQEQILHQDPGLEPSSTPPEIAIQTKVRELDGAPSVVEPRPALLARAARLPVPPTPTVGRTEDLARLRAMATDPGVQLVSVIGPAGVGKTRLAVELARALTDQLPDGAYFVSLAPVNSVDQVPSTIARALGVAEVPEGAATTASSRIARFGPCLLVLDNFEHLLDAAPFVSDLLAERAARDGGGHQPRAAARPR